MESQILTFPVEPLPLASSGLLMVYARQLLDQYLREQLSKNQVPLPPLPNVQLPKTRNVEHLSFRKREYQGRVCIVGAGVAGLYVAMMLKYLGIHNVDILEASNRVGGRCYTHKFPDDDECPHNYYDIGGMRIPDIDCMRSTSNLIDMLKLQDRKRPYTYDLGYDPPSLYLYSHVKQPSAKKFEAAITDPVDVFVKDFPRALEEAAKSGDDNYSTRSWLMQKKGMSYMETVEAEAAITSTGLFDQSLTETLCDYSDFQAAKDQPWYRLEGGMSILTDTMQERLASSSWPKKPSPSKGINVSCETPVVAMEDKGNKVHVTTADAFGDLKTEEYDMVFNTTAMAPLQRMDLEGLHLDDDVLTGIRTLSYDRATKVAIKFKSPWWDSFYQKPEDFGGISGTDLPIGNVVYPSWRDGKDKHAVLIVSYNWAQDATRMGAMIPDYNVKEPSRGEPLVTLCLRNLAKLWSKQPNAPTFEFLSEQYLTHHAWSWSHDPYTGGAFALFGPGQFKHIYPAFQKTLCGNKFAMCGEALSINHGWISGSLDSAYGAVLRWLHGLKRHDDIETLWKSNFGAGAQKHTPEIDEKLAMGTVELCDIKEGMKRMEF